MLTGNIRAAMTAAAFLMLSSVPLPLSRTEERLQGTVQDASGGVPEAKVTLTNTQTGVTFNVPTNSAGDYTVPQLQPGMYNIRVEREGFRPATVSGRCAKCFGHGPRGRHARSGRGCAGGRSIGERSRALHGKRQDQRHR